MKYCVVNFGSRRSWYPDGQARLRKSFEDNGYEGDFKFFHDEHELECPAHSEVPYAFKPYSIKWAKDHGYDRVIWCDCSIALIKPFSRIEKQLDEVGYYLIDNYGFNTGQWCSDAALKTLEITRDESFNIPHLSASVMAFDFTRPICITWLEQYFARSNDGSFRGEWENNNQNVSIDHRVKGHRHDQTAASVIAHKLGMNEWQKGCLRYYDPGLGDAPDNIVFVLRHG
jgi:hypothetical protein